MSLDGAHPTMDHLRLHERVARQEGAHEGTVNDIVRLEHAVGELRREIHSLTLEIRHGHAGATWAALFAGAFAGSVSGFCASIGFAMWLVAKGVVRL